MYYYRYIIVSLFLLLCVKVQAQEFPIDTANLPVLFDTTGISNLTAPDTLDADTAVSDTLQSVQQADTVGDIETTIKYTAEDSFFFDYQNKIVKLYGNAQVTYGDISLKAAEIELDWKTNTVTANGKIDSTGEMIGKPVFNDKGQVYETVGMSYNFNTEKAVIKGVVTQQGEAFMHASRIKKDPNDIVYGQGMRYTTCNLPDPHFHIEARRFKKLPKGSTLVGPFHLEVNDIPTPVGFLFGMFPNKRERASGIIVPSYGEERRRGFYLRGAGYYFNISDYMDLTLLGELYSKGSYGLELETNYKKRYGFDGRFKAEFSKQKIMSREGQESISNDLWVEWSHRPVSLRNSRISADISMGTSSYNENNFDYNMQRNSRQEFRSSVTYGKTFKGTPFSLGASVRFNQNVTTGQATLIFPDISLNMNRIYPFKNLPGKNSAWYKKIYFGQNFNYRKTISNAVQDTTETGQVQTIYPDFWSNFTDHWQRAQTDQSQAQPLSFDIPLSTSFNVLKYFNVSPTIRYTEQWSFNALEYTYDEEQDRIVSNDQRGGFYRAFRTSFGAQVKTNFYGFFNPRLPGVERIRHVITPTVDFSYTPDLSGRVFGYYKNYEFETENGDTTAYLRRLASAPGVGESGVLTFQLDNNIEMKVRTKRDTTGEARKVPILENLSFRTRYDYLKDSFQLDNIRFSGRTRLFRNKISLSFSGVVDPYAYRVVDEERGREMRINQYAWLAGQGLGRLSSGNVSISGSFSGDRRGGGVDQVDRESLTEDEQAELNQVVMNPEMYVDFNIPWQVSFQYSIRYNRINLHDSRISQVVSFDGNLSLTEKWKLSFNSGYDFDRKEFTTTSLNIHRDLHCWQMSFSWVPFGRFQSYNLTINAKSSLLQDLKINKRRSYHDY